MSRLEALDRRTVLWVSGVSAVLLFAALALINGTLTDHGHGIIAFEFAGSQDRAQEILGDWGDEGKDAAVWSLLVDFPFIAAYTVFLFTASTGIGRRAALLAGGCDVIENLALLLVVGEHTSVWPAVAFAFAAVKFAAIVVAWIGVATRLRGRERA